MTQAPTPGPLPNMPIVDLTDDMLFKIETGETVTWGEIKRRLAPTAPVEASGSEREDTFNGDDTALVASITALLDLPDSALSHRVPGLAKQLLASAASRLSLRPQPSGETRAELIDYLGQEFSDTYDCKRVWSAWSYGTMGEDDFEPVSNRIDDIADAILALLSARPLALGGQQGEVKRVRHKKRGTEYTIIGVGRAQGEISDEDPVVLYRGDNDGGLWVRHQAEFSDGRFEYITTPARAEALDEGAAGEPVAWQAMRNGRPLGSVWPYSDRCGADLWLSGGVGDEVRPLYAHPSPTPAADADRVRIAVEALDRVRDDLYFDGLDAESQYAVEQALAAVKSEGN